MLDVGDDWRRLGCKGFLDVQLGGTILLPAHWTGLRFLYIMTLTNIWIICKLFPCLAVMLWYILTTDLVAICTHWPSNQRSSSNVHLFLDFSEERVLLCSSFAELDYRMSHFL
jgi:hypothetical protein